jgi:hypothetical protein
MKTFQPNGAVIDAFLQTARAARPKLSQFLLKKAGIASHDIRLLSSENRAVTTSTSEIFDSFAEYKRFHRLAWNTRFRIFNASRTAPALLELHWFLALPNGVSRMLAIEQDARNNPESHFTTKLDLAQSSGEESVRSVSVPVLESGRGLEVSERTFSVGIRYSLDPSLDANLANDSELRAPPDVCEASERCFDLLRSEAQIWVGLVLDNEELLPYFWNGQEQRYVPGFFTDGTVVPP